MEAVESLSVTSPHRGPAAHPGGETERAVVWLLGEHDITTVDELTETLSRAVALDDTDLVVDLSGVRFISAATVGAIVGSSERLRLLGRSMFLRSPSRFARRILDVCGLAHLLDPSPDDAPATPGCAGRAVAPLEIAQP